MFVPDKPQSTVLNAVRHVAKEKVRRSTEERHRTRICEVLLEKRNDKSKHMKEQQATVLYHLMKVNAGDEQ
jgi:hypothetical protein